MMMASEKEPYGGGDQKCRTDRATESGTKHISIQHAAAAWEYEYPGTGVSFP